MEQKFKGGVLIIGSLIWDGNPIRENWRNNFLDVSKIKVIPLPIRYGRISPSRKNTYTMVLSTECLSNGQIGKGLLVPLKLESYPSINQHCEELIKAEKNNSKTPTRYNHGFFAIALLVNPNTENIEVKQVQENWSSYFGNGFNNEQYKVGSEEPVITENGFLNIPWINDFDEYDFIICTVIKPEQDEYPNTKKISDAIKNNQYYEYLYKNIENRITTFQDNKIKSKLP